MAGRYVAMLGDLRSSSSHHWPVLVPQVVSALADLPSIILTLMVQFAGCVQHAKVEDARLHVLDALLVRKVCLEYTESDLSPSLFRQVSRTSYRGFYYLEANNTTRKSYSCLFPD